MTLPVLILAALLAADAPAPAPAAAPAPAPAPVRAAAFASPAPGIRSGGRLTADDVARLAAEGTRHVVDLSLDTETPDFDEAAVVRAAGMRYDALPVAGAAGLDRMTVEAFDRLLQGSERPVVVHCASGNRVGALAALRAAWIEGRPAEEAIAEGRRWGLKGLEGAVRERLAADPVVTGR